MSPYTLPSATCNRKRIFSDQWTVAIYKNSLKSSEICWLSFKKTCKEILANTSTQSYPFAMVPNTSSMEFGLVEESSLVRQNSLLVERGKGLSDRGRSLTSLVNRCLLAIRLTVEWWWPRRSAIYISDIPASPMPMIYHRTAFECCGEPILYPEQKNQEIQF
jgi:hypothetical protein